MLDDLLEEDLFWLVLKWTVLGPGYLLHWIWRSVTGRRGSCGAFTAFVISVAAWGLLIGAFYVLVLGPGWKSG